MPHYQVYHINCQVAAEIMEQAQDDPDAACARIADILNDARGSYGRHYAGQITLMSNNPDAKPDIFLIFDSK